MSVVDSHRWLFEALQSLAGVRHRSIVVHGESPAVDMSALPAFLIGLVHDRARELLAGGDRHVETFSEHQLVARRLGDVVVCLVIDAGASTAEIDRKLNVLAVRQKAVAARAPNPANLLRVRDAFVAAAGPFGDRVFDRDWDSYRRAVVSVTDTVVIAFGRTLISRLGPPQNHVFAAALDLLQAETGVGRAAVDPRSSTIPAARHPSGIVSVGGTTVATNEIRASFIRHAGPFSEKIYDRTFDEVRRHCQVTNTSIDTLPAVRTLVTLLEDNLKTYSRTRFVDEVERILLTTPLKVAG